MVLSCRDFCCSCFYNYLSTYFKTSSKKSNRRFKRLLFIGDKINQFLINPIIYGYYFFGSSNYKAYIWKREIYLKQYYFNSSSSFISGIIFSSLWDGAYSKQNFFCIKGFKNSTKGCNIFHLLHIIF